MQTVTFDADGERHTVEYRFTRAGLLASVDGEDAGAIRLRAITPDLADFDLGGVRRAGADHPRRRHALRRQPARRARAARGGAVPRPVRRDGAGLAAGADAGDRGPGRGGGRATGSRPGRESS